MEALLTGAWRYLTAFTEQEAAGEVVETLEWFLLGVWVSLLQSLHTLFMLLARQTAQNTTQPFLLVKPAPGGLPGPLPALSETCRGYIAHPAWHGSFQESRAVHCRVTSQQGAGILPSGISVAWGHSQRVLRLLPSLASVSMWEMGRRCSLRLIPETVCFLCVALWEEGEKFVLGRKGWNIFRVMKWVFSFIPCHTESSLKSSL